MENTTYHRVVITHDRVSPVELWLGIPAQTPLLYHAGHCGGRRRVFLVVVEVLLAMSVDVH